MMGKMTSSTPWFTTRVIAPGVWAIDDHGASLMYLVTGKTHALLIDTGWGVGDLAGLVASLTPLPFRVINTHGHPDHTCGNGQFPAVAIAAADAPFIQTPFSPEARQEVAAHLPRPLPSDFDVTTWAARVPTIQVLPEEATFDLGGCILEVLPLPGHSGGSICLLERQARLLFVGDSILSGALWLHLEESRPLREFYRGLQGLQALPNFDVLLPGHGALDRLPLPRTVLDDLSPVSRRSSPGAWLDDQSPPSPALACAATSGRAASCTIRPGWKCRRQMRGWATFENHRYPHRR